MSTKIPNVNKFDMARTMESIKEYLRACHGVSMASLAYMKRKTIRAQTYGDYLLNATPDNEMITRPLDKNKLLLETSADRVNNCTAEYIIDNRMVYDVLDQICKDTDLCSYIKQHESARYGRGAFYAT